MHIHENQQKTKQKSNLIGCHTGSQTVIQYFAILDTLESVYGNNYSRFAGYLFSLHSWRLLYYPSTVQIRD